MSTCEHKRLLANCSHGIQLFSEEFDKRTRFDRFRQDGMLGQMRGLIEAHGVTRDEDVREIAGLESRMRTNSVADVETGFLSQPNVAGDNADLRRVLERADGSVQRMRARG